MLVHMTDRSWAFCLVVIFTLILGITGERVGAASRTSAQRIHVRHGAITVDARISSRAVAMKPAPSTTWQKESASIIVRITGSSPDVTVWAIPSYGTIDMPGRHVDATYLLKYRAVGDHSDAQPLYSGLPLRPDARKTSGSAKFDLPLSSGISLRVRLDVVNGKGVTSLADPAHPEDNIVFEGARS